MSKITLRKGSVIRYADTPEALTKLKKMGYKEVDSKPVKVEDEKSEGDKEPEDDKKSEGDKEPEDDKKPEGNKEPEGDKKPETDEKPKGTRGRNK